MKALSNPPRTLTSEIEFPEAVFARLPGGITPDFLLRSDIRNEDIELKVAYPFADGSETQKGDFLQLLVNGNPVGDEIALPPEAAFATLLLRASDRPAGNGPTPTMSSINYRVYYRTGGDNAEDGSHDQAFITDFVAPGGAALPAMSFDPKVIEHGVSVDDLSDDGDGRKYLAALVSPYFGPAVGDWVQGLIEGNESWTSAVREIREEDFGANVVLKFSEEVLRKADLSGRKFSYRITDRAGNVSPESSAVGLRIRLTPPLTIDQTPLSLTGPMHRHEDRPVPNPPEGAFAQRTASGGVPPYTYTVDNAVVEIDANTGRVISWRNGTGTVTATDANGDTASYSITVGNCWTTYSVGSGWWSTMHSVVTNGGGDYPAIASWEALRDCYNGRHGLEAQCWTANADGPFRHFAIYPHTGETQSLVTTSINPLGKVLCQAWGMRRYDFKK